MIIRHDLAALDEHLVLMLVENTQRRDLNPMERAEAYDALRNLGFTLTEIARRTGAQIATVSHYLNLMMLGEREREEVRAGTRSAHRSIELVRAAKQVERVGADKRPVGRPKGAKTKPYLSEVHPLATQARALCGHRGRPKYGTVACGPCWEQAIRDDIAGAVVGPAPEYGPADDLTVDAILAGAWKTPCGPAEKAAVARRWLMGHGNTLHDLERLTGWRVSRYFTTDDLFNQDQGAAS